MSPPDERRRHKPEEYEVASEAVASASEEAKKSAVREALKSASDDSEAEVVAEAVASASTLEGRKVAAAEAVRSAPDEAKQEIVDEAIGAVTPELKKRIIADSMQELSPKDQDDLIRNIQHLPGDVKKEVATRAAQTLDAQDRAELANTLVPDQAATNTIWLTIVRAFSVVFIGSSAGLIAAIFVGAQDIQLLLTVVTTVAGLLAGFISGRASSTK